jgi:hypothetical protein
VLYGDKNGGYYVKRVYITFSGRAYDETTAKILASAPGFGADEVRIYDDKWLMQQLAPNFYTVNKWLWETKRKFGFGWCAWKPYIILDALSRLSNGDVVLYTDADTYPIADLSILFSECQKRGVVLFDCQGWVNKRVVRRDCFIAMGQDEKKYWDGKHACGRFQLFKRGDYLGHQILMEWLTYSVNPLCQQWEEYQSQYGPEFDDFYVHRTEQSVLSLLANKYNVQLYREACGFGWPIDEAYCKANNVIGDLYPQLFVQEDARGPRTLEGSRFRNVET